MLVRSLELQEVSNNLCQRISNFVFTSHHVKTCHINNHERILKDNCTFMIRNKDLVSSSELLSMWSIIEEKGF